MRLKEILPFLDDGQLDALLKFRTMLAEWNEKFNLTAITDEEEVFIKHFADSLAALPLLPEGAKLLDIGCGAGLPSIPLKIARPSVDATLIDSVGKKITFVNAAIAALGLSGIRAAHERIEDHKSCGYDLAVARAVSAMPTLLEYALPFLRLGGRFLCYKASGCGEEIAESANALRVLGGEVSEIKDIVLPGGIERKIVVVRKVKDCPKGYPRGKNAPRLKPI